MLNLSYQTLQVEKKGYLLEITLNRPEMRNAFNGQMIADLTDVFQQIEKMENIRVGVLRGHGKTFCAGADLKSMREMVQFNFEENYADGLALATCLRTIYDCSKPTIALVHGAVMGGGNGLMATCDISIAEQNTVFSFTEVKLGLVPACIAPFVIKRVGEYHARRLMLTAQQIDATRAQQLGLIDVVSQAHNVEQTLAEYTKMLYEASPKAIAQCKKLLHTLCNGMDLDHAGAYTANALAEARISEQGQEGMTAFLEKRNPNWLT